MTYWRRRRSPSCIRLLFSGLWPLPLNCWIMSFLSFAYFSSASHEGQLRIYAAEFLFLVSVLFRVRRVCVRSAFGICGWSSRPYIRVLDVVVVNTLTRLHV